MSDLEYLEHINKFANTLREFKETVNTIKDNWVAATGYAFPSGLIQFNAAFRRILNDLEAEREDVESFILNEGAVKSEVM